MRVPQLTLYDFLADFLPGAVALGLLSSLLWLVGFSGPPLTTNTGIVLVVTSYPVGRSIHAVAGQVEIQALRKQTFDNFIFELERTRLRAGLVPSDLAVQEEPKVVDQLVSAYKDGASDEMRFNDWIDKEVVDAFTVSDGRSSHTKSTDEVSRSAASISTADIDWTAKESFGQLQRFGFSELFDTSTLYQRYNILETFYRNLWLVSAYFSVLFFTVGVAGILAPAPLWERLLIIAVGVWTIFWLLVFRPSLCSVGFVSGLLLVLYFSGTLLTLPSRIQLLSTLTVVGLSTLAPSIVDKCGIDWFGIGRILDDTSLPCYYLLSGLFVCLLILVFPVGLLFNQLPQSTVLDATLFGGVGLVLFILAILFDLRRLQFKDRQVRAFINDLYRHQQTPDGQD